MMLGIGGLSVDTPSPDALCPPLEQTRRAVESRLGSVELEGTWRATYVLVHREAGDWITLQLRDPTGTVRLEREFSATSGSCSTLAQVIALVLERYFLRPETQFEATVAPAPSSTPVRVQEPSPRTFPVGLVSSPVRVQWQLREPAPPSQASRLELGYDAGFWATTAWVAPTVGLALHGLGGWSVGLAGGFDLSDHASRVGAGWGESRRFPVALQGRGRLLDLGALHLVVGTEILGLYERVRTLNLPETGDAARVVPGFGFRIGAELLPNRRDIGPFLELTADWLLRGMSRPFEVDHEPAFDLPNVVIGLGFGLRAI